MAISGAKDPNNQVGLYGDDARNLAKNAADFEEKVADGDFVRRQEGDRVIFKNVGTGRDQVGCEPGVNEDGYSGVKFYKLTEDPKWRHPLFTNDFQKCPDGDPSTIESITARRDDLQRDIRALPQEISRKEANLKLLEKELQVLENFFNKYNLIRQRAFNYKLKLSLADEAIQSGDQDRAKKLQEEAKALKPDAELWEKLAEKWPGKGVTGFHGWLEERGEDFAKKGKNGRVKSNQRIRDRRLGYKRLSELAEYINDRDSLGFNIKSRVDFQKWTELNGNIEAVLLGVENYIEIKRASIEIQAEKVANLTNGFLEAREKLSQLSDEALKATAIAQKPNKKAPGRKTEEVVIDYSPIEFGQEEVGEVKSNLLSIPVGEFDPFQFYFQRGSQEASRICLARWEKSKDQKQKDYDCLLVAGMAYSSLDNEVLAKELLDVWFDQAYRGADSVARGRAVNSYKSVVKELQSLQSTLPKRTTLDMSSLPAGTQIKLKPLNNQDFAPIKWITVGREGGSAQILSGNYRVDIYLPKGTFASYGYEDLKDRDSYQIDFSNADVFEVNSPKLKAAIKADFEATFKQVANKVKLEVEKAELEDELAQRAAKAEAIREKQDIITQRESELRAKKAELEAKLPEAESAAQAEEVISLTKSAVHLESQVIENPNSIMDFNKNIATLTQLKATYENLLDICPSRLDEKFKSRLNDVNKRLEASKQDLKTSSIKSDITKLEAGVKELEKNKNTPKQCMEKMKAYNALGDAYYKLSQVDESSQASADKAKARVALNKVIEYFNIYSEKSKIFSDSTRRTGMSHAQSELDKAQSLLKKL